jgi:hypothetical protein
MQNFAILKDDILALEIDGRNSEKSMNRLGYVIDFSTKYTLASTIIPKL